MAAPNGRSSNPETLLLRWLTGVSVRPLVALLLLTTGCAASPYPKDLVAAMNGPDAPEAFNLLGGGVSASGLTWEADYELDGVDHFHAAVVGWPTDDRVEFTSVGTFDPHDMEDHERGMWVEFEIAVFNDPFCVVLIAGQAGAVESDEAEIDHAGTTYAWDVGEGHGMPSNMDCQRGQGIDPPLEE